MYILFYPASLWRYCNLFYSTCNLRKYVSSEQEPYIPCYFSSSWTIYDMYSLLFLFLLSNMWHTLYILFYFSSSWPCVQCTTYSVLFQLLMGSIWHVFSVISAPPGPVCNVKPPMTWTRLRTHFLMLFTGSLWPSYYKTLNVLNAME